MVGARGADSRRGGGLRLADGGPGGNDAAMTTTSATPQDAGSALLTTNRKALTLNLRQGIYGTFAEIGAGQEVVRNFFKAGGASGTVAKSMSAYDMKISDDVYGKASRYVSRERLSQMLAFEYELLVKRLGADRGDTSAFFVFANTVATTSFKSGGDGHAWMGLRFQAGPKGAPNEIHLHVRLWDKEASLQQDAVGIVGVNLIYAAYFQRDSQEAFLRALVDNVGAARVEVDFLHVSGPEFARYDNRVVALKLVESGLTNAAAFGTGGAVEVPGEMFYKKAVLVERGLFRPVTTVSVDMMERAAARFAQDDESAGAHLLKLFEISVPAVGAVPLDYGDLLARIDLNAAAGYPALVSNYREFYRIPAYFRRYTKERVAIVAGINNLVDIFSDVYYTHLDGGVLEACGRLFKDKVRMYVYPMRRVQLRRLAASLEGGRSLFEDSTEGDAESVVTAENVPMRPAVRHLYAHLLENGLVRSLCEYDPAALNCRPRTLLARIHDDEPGWEHEVPGAVAEIIRQKRPWGGHGVGAP